MAIEALLLILRGTLAVVLASSGVVKLVQRHVDTSPVSWAIKGPKVWRALGALEFLLGMALLVQVAWFGGAIAATALFAGFAVVMARTVLRGVTGDCMCGGLLPLPRVGWGHVAVNGLLATAALLACLLASIYPPQTGAGTTPVLLALPAIAMLLGRASGALVRIRRLNRTPSVIGTRPGAAVSGLGGRD